MRQERKVPFSLVDLDRLILGDHTRSRTRRIEQNPIESTDDAWEFTTVDVGDDDVTATQSSDVTTETLDATSTRIIGPDFSRVAHQSGHVRRLTTRCGRHIEHAFVGLGIERDDGEEGRSGLEDVLTREVFGRRSYGNSSAGEDLKTDF
ncbi:BQ5605_C012g06854 [Microbotryum silenes-dioicae]|uniref:BQ5605_C012g06854 protein n=1 Tax=Microbotryum silenes-dioicae TaxID=796604 RepID=A0A2X0LWB0_9BASI|nr:BQ5605_C012g06854 [Microbotryum silenes-dioicae]